MRTVDTKRISRDPIRLATTSDASLLADLGARTFYEAFAALIPDEDMAAYLAASFTSAGLAAQIADRLSLFLIAETDGVAVGYAHLCPTQPPACVDGPSPVQLVRLYVLKKRYGHGVGSSLMATCLSEASKRGYQTLWLSSWEINQRANSFYRRWGFEPVGNQDFVVGHDVQHDVILSRKI